MTVQRMGGCVCGNIRYKVKGEPKRITICHCTWCQRRTGSAFGVEVVFDDTQVAVDDEFISRYRHISDESGRWLEQHFCNECGSNIGFILETVPGIRTIAAGTFDDQSWLDPEKYHRCHVFTRSARGWTDIPTGVECYEKHFRG